ncbi:uncharacterized protein Z520_12006 [Fonsecaea multimorphosa CBS 102226]|uniref:AB hydrolase-1 domain-containing protein n=1 Tax=Fonsecaea multimorphosa CBS 102226 TaxID=1442371 RepID=A0A0D2GRW0_9EURO|nr:uncharacterized protein Z520_12006 [Fonsecaea multimorphosa CBS 102226]KIX92260.1 hypothetical protein Z520_12006 [Fonsecaea multimorphosa CBS 102226]OAL17634.1 hypothetical protein AYO22_11424 [Fonsecaea multimorphosa]
MALATGAYSSPVARSTIAGIPSVYLEVFKNPSIQTSIGGHAICISGTVDVTASATNLEINMPPITNQSDLTSFVTNFMTINSTVVKDYIGGPKQISGTWGIYSELCFPIESNGVPNTTVQFLVHGGGYDRSYWNFAPGYSYVDYVAQQGYTTFLYDRLGSGLSDHPDGTNVVQMPLQIEIAHELVQLLRTGGFSNGTAPFEKVIGVGHSIGSIVSNGVTGKHPKDFDAAVLTGFSTSLPGGAISFSGIDLNIAALADPSRFDGLAYDYATAGSKAAVEFFFFKAPNFDPKILDMSDALKQTLAVGEIITDYSLAVASNFTAPVFVVNGGNDLPNCLGNCLSPTNISAQVIEELYPAASNTSSYYVLPVCGHGLNAHYTANVAYDQIYTWLQKNGF